MYSVFHYPGSGVLAEEKLTGFSLYNGSVHGEK